MVAGDHEPGLIRTDASVLFERQLDARHARVVHALAKKRDGLVPSPPFEDATQAFVSGPEGPLVFGKALLARVQGKLNYPGRLTLTIRARPLGSRDRH